VAFLPDGHRLVSSSSSEIKMWDSEQAAGDLTLEDDHPVLGLAFSPDGTRLASAGRNGMVRVWDVAAGRSGPPLKGHAGMVWSVAFSPDGAQLASTGSDGTIRLWDAATGRGLKALEIQGGSVRGVAFSRDGHRMAAASGEVLKAWDTAIGREILSLKKGGVAEISAKVAISPDGALLASGGKPGEMKLWDAATGRAIRTWRTAGLEGLAFSPDGRYLLYINMSGSTDNRSLKVVDLESGSISMRLEGHTASVLAVSFSPDGRRIASAGEDNTVRLWDTSTGQETLTLKGHTATIFAVAFSPDGRRIASAGLDKTIRVWCAAPRDR
jgi:WD40 repeat protein